MANPMDAALATMVANLKEKTGKSLEQWVALVRKQQLGKHGEIVKWLKAEQALTHGYASLVARSALAAASGAGPASGAELIDAQYAGAKAGLRPIYERLAAQLAKFGADVELAPKKGYVSVRRSKQFALLQPSTAERLDVGISLKGVACTPRLEAAGSFNAMVTHRVRVPRIEQLDAELLGWLKQAYERA